VQIHEEFSAASRGQAGIAPPGVADAVQVALERQMNAARITDLIQSMFLVNRRNRETPPPIVDERQRMDALFGNPEAWDSLRNDDLAALLRYQCLTYGATKDDRRGWHVHTLHRVVARRLDIQERVALFHDLVRAIVRFHAEERIDRGCGLTKALGSFFLAEPDPNLLAESASVFASLVPPEAEPLRGVAMVLTESERVSDRRRGALLGGVARLGDRRVLARVDAARRRLGTDGQTALLQSHFCNVTRGWVDLLVGWLEEAALADPSAPIVTEIAQSLADLPEKARATSVMDIHRRFPGTEIAGDEPRTILEQWTLAEFATERLTPRFMGLARMGVDHRLVWAVLRAWGLKGEQLRLRDCAGDKPAGESVKVVA
jgi:hypothetical protein